MPGLDLERVPSKAELTEGIDVPPVPRPYYQGATRFKRGQGVEVGSPFPGTAQRVKGLGVISGLESHLVSATGAPVAVVAYLEGVDSHVGVPHTGLGSKNGLPNETIRDLAAGPVVPDAKTVWTIPSMRTAEAGGVRVRAGSR